MDCVNFAIDPSAGYNYGIIRKTLHKIDFYLSALECAASTPTFSAKITVVKNKIFDIVSTINGNFKKRFFFYFYYSKSYFKNA